jgi:hypothetical protein
MIGAFAPCIIDPSIPAPGCAAAGTMEYRIDFDSIAWESPLAGVRHKVVVHDARKLRLVEYTGAMEAHWCERGHVGCILDGILEIEFADGVRTFRTGDGVLIPDGKEHRHRARVLSDTVRALFVEDV